MIWRTNCLFLESETPHSYFKKQPLFLSSVWTHVRMWTSLSRTTLNNSAFSVFSQIFSGFVTRVCQQVLLRNHHGDPVCASGRDLYGRPCGGLLGAPPAFVHCCVAPLGHPTIPIPPFRWSQNERGPGPASHPPPPSSPSSLGRGSASPCPTAAWPWRPRPSPRLAAMQESNTYIVKVSGTSGWSIFKQCNGFHPWVHCHLFVIVWALSCVKIASNDLKWPNGLKWQIFSLPMVLGPALWAFWPRMETKTHWFPTVCASHFAPTPFVLYTFVRHLFFFT